MYIMFTFGLVRLFDFLLQLMHQNSDIRKKLNYQKVMAPGWPALGLHWSHRKEWGHCGLPATVYRGPNLVIYDTY